MLPGAPLYPNNLPTHPPVREILVFKIRRNDMAPRLSISKLHMIRDMIENQSFTTS